MIHLVKLEDMKKYLKNGEIDESTKTVFAKAIEGYVDSLVKTPFLDTLEKDIYVPYRISNIFRLTEISIDLINAHGSMFDKDYLMRLPKDKLDERIDTFDQFTNASEKSDRSESIHRKAMAFLINDSSKKYLLAYLNREIDWIVVSIMSASYISANIISRSVFELLVDISNRRDGVMKKEFMVSHFFPQKKKKS